MAAFTWRGTDTVEDWLYSEPWCFDFFQAVRLLEIAAGETHPENRDRELVRFRSSLSLAFPASDVLSLKRPGADHPPEMTVAFLSSGGAYGPLPTSFTEELLRRISKHDDYAAAEFLDLFHHRLLALAYRVRKAHQLALASTYPEQTPQARYLFSYIGLGLPALSERLEVPDRALLRYAGLLTARPRSAAALAVLLSDYFGTSIRIEQFVGAWFYFGPDRQTRIGYDGANNVLGEDAVVGDRVWDQSAGIRVHIGPISYSRYLLFLPGARAHAELRELIRFYAGPDFLVRIRVAIAVQPIPAARLGAARLGAPFSVASGTGSIIQSQIPSAEIGSTRLGWTAWIGSPTGAGSVEFCSSAFDGAEPGSTS